MAPFKSSLAKSAGKLFGVFKEADLSLRGATQSTRHVIQPFTATGGTKSTPGNGYIYHVFTSPADTPAPYTFQVTAGTGDLNLLVVGGGGGGGGKYGGSAGGGGGGAGLVHDRLLLGINPGTYPITVGSGGLGNTYPQDSASENGGNSVFNAPGGGSVSAVTAAGGGGGGGGPAPYHLGLPGGSGGGNAYADPDGNTASTGSGDPFPGSGSTISPSNGWGNDGGTATPANRRAGSGGGAGGAGGAGAAAGGVGIEISWVLPTHGETKYFAGGGGAGYYPAPGTGADGGNGGGGNGGPGPTPASNGQASTGGGAGGMESGGSTKYRGGSGVVIIRYAVAG